MSIWPQAISYLRPSREVRFGQAGDRVLGRGVGRGVRPRRVRRDRAVVDDAPAARALALHQPERLLGAEERAGQVDVHHLLPLLGGQIFQRNAGRAPMPALLNSTSSRPKRAVWSARRAPRRRRASTRTREPGQLPLQSCSDECHLTRSLSHPSAR